MNDRGAVSAHLVERAATIALVATFLVPAALVLAFSVVGAVETPWGVAAICFDDLEAQCRNTPEVLSAILGIGLVLLVVAVLLIRWNRRIAQRDER